MHGFALAAAAILCLAGSLVAPAHQPKIVAPALEAYDNTRLAMGVPLETTPVVVS